MSKCVSVFAAAALDTTFRRPCSQMTKAWATPSNSAALLQNDREIALQRLVND